METRSESHSIRKTLYQDERLAAFQKQVQRQSVRAQ